MSVSFFAMICTLTIFGLNDYLWSKIVPKAIYGTSTLDYKRDFFIKKGPMTIMMQSLASGPFIEKLYIFLKIKKDKKKIELS
jgi:hypothetical protein